MLCFQGILGITYYQILIRVQVGFNLIMILLIGILETLDLGYGDNDDETIIPTTISVFIRKTFEIYDTDAIESVLLDIDYDDGFVAYINGQEIARSMLTGSMPDYNQTTDGWREPNLPQGLVPERFAVDSELLNNGINVIAVQVHNHSINSSDLTALPVLSLGINNSSSAYNTPPSWFEEPLIPNEIDFQSSNLPIVIINTEGGQDIPNNPKIDATMQIIYRENGDRNFLSDISDPDAIHYDGDIKIEYRGSTSSLIDKKQYAFTPYDELGEKVNVSFLDMPKENDWILNGLAYDPSYIRDFLSYKLSREIGNYASRGRYCELILNGDFRGYHDAKQRYETLGPRIELEAMAFDEMFEHHKAWFLEYTGDHLDTSGAKAPANKLTKAQQAALKAIEKRNVAKVA